MRSATGIGNGWKPAPGIVLAGSCLVLEISPFVYHTMSNVHSKKVIFGSSVPLK